MPYTQQQQYAGYPKMGEPKSMKQLPDGQQNMENMSPITAQRMGPPPMMQQQASLKRTIEAKLHMNSLWAFIIIKS